MYRKSTSEYGDLLVRGTKQPVTRMSEYNSIDLAGIDYTGLNQDGKRPSCIVILLITVGQLQATAMR